ENSWVITSLGLRGFEQPTLSLAFRIELGEGGKTAAHSREDKRIFCVGNRFRHDAPTAVRKLIETPKLFGVSGKGWQCDEFPALSGGQCPVSPGNCDFEIGRAKVAARVGDWLNRPLLLGLTHVIRHANINVTHRPSR